jgi:hypothetical protein
VDIKGVDTLKDKINVPANWSLDYGKNRGNLYSYVSVQPGEASPGGGKVLKASYFPSPNKNYKLVPIAIDGRNDDSPDFFRVTREEWEPVPAGWAAWSRSTDTFILRQTVGALKNNGTYHLSFKVKGNGIEGGACTLALLGVAENAPKKLKRGERGGVSIERNETKNEEYIIEPFSSGSTWKVVDKTFTVTFKDGAVKKLDTTTLAVLEFKFNLPQYAADCEICDVQITPKK